MIDDLHKARYQSLDPFEGAMIVTSWTEPDGRRGRPRINVDLDVLTTAVGLRPLTKVAEAFNCCTRTLRRRLVDAGLAERGPPVSVTQVQPDGTVTIHYTATRAAMSGMSDEFLDGLVSDIIQTFPDFGRSMISGALKAEGHRISPKRLRESFIRVHGTPGIFGARRIARRKYQVPGANSLWHHDGQHGKPLISRPSKPR